MPDSEITNEVESQQNRLIARAMYGLLATASVMLVSLSVWVVNECVESRQFRMGGDRYTQKDAATERADMIERLTRVREDVTRMQFAIERIEKGMP